MLKLPTIVMCLIWNIYTHTHTHTALTAPFSREFGLRKNTITKFHINFTVDAIRRTMDNPFYSVYFPFSIKFHWIIAQTQQNPPTSLYILLDQCADEIHCVQIFCVYFSSDVRECASLVCFFVAGRWYECVSIYETRQELFILFNIKWEREKEWAMKLQNETITRWVLVVRLAGLVPIIDVGAIQIMNDLVVLGS